ncbi:MAG: T9SS type A sorting domain-containing protein [Flavobacteriales bacterium]
MTACNSYTSPSGNYTWTTSGVYNDTIPNANNCDSVMTFNLTINYSTSSSQTITACNSYTSPSGNDVWTISGIYMDTITNLAGCDSFMTIDLTINNSSNGVLVTQACDSMVSPSGNYVWTESGTYIDTLVNSFGCDSFLLVTLTVNSTQYVNQAVSACDSYELPGGNVVTTGGVYIDTLMTTGGCDSIITTDLTINSSSVTNISETACNSYLWVVNGQTYTSSGQYQGVLTSSTGCDSTVIMDLVITQIETSIEVTGTMEEILALTSNEVSSGVSYQWLSCDPDFQPIAEETNVSFTPGVYGSYAVEITLNGCVDTSACFNAGPVGIVEGGLAQLRVYPNPTNGRVSIELPNASDNVRVDVMAADGRLVRSESHTSGTSFIETMIDGPAGLYFISVKVGGESSRVVRVVKE